MSQGINLMSFLIALPALATGQTAFARTVPTPEPNLKFCNVEEKMVNGVETLVLALLHRCSP